MVSLGTASTLAEMQAAGGKRGGMHELTHGVVVNRPVGAGLARGAEHRAGMAVSHSVWAYHRKSVMQACSGRVACEDREQERAWSVLR